MVCPQLLNLSPGHQSISCCPCSPAGTSPSSQQAGPRVPRAGCPRTHPPEPGTSLLKPPGAFSRSDLRGSFPISSFTSRADVRLPSPCSWLKVTPTVTAGANWQEAPPRDARGFSKNSLRSKHRAPNIHPGPGVRRLLMRADLVAIEPRSKCSLKPEPGVGGSAGGVGAAALPGHTAEAGLRAAELQLRPGKSWCHWGRTAGIAALPWALKEQLWESLGAAGKSCTGSGEVAGDCGAPSLIPPLAISCTQTYFNGGVLRAVRMILSRKAEMRWSDSALLRLGCFSGYSAVLGECEQGHCSKAAAWGGGIAGFCGSCWW